MVELTVPAAVVVVWLVTWLLHSTLLYGGAWLVERFGLLRSAAAREHLWRAAMLGALLTATLQTTGLVERVPLGKLFAATEATAGTAAEVTADPAAVSEPTAAAAAAAAPASMVMHGSFSLDVPLAADAKTPASHSMSATISTSHVTPAVSAEPVSSAEPVASAARSLPDRLRDVFSVLGARGGDVVFGLWLIGAGVAVLRLVVLGWLARRQLVGRVPADGGLAADFTALCTRLRVRRPALCVAPALAGPISLPNGEIVVPPWAVASLDGRQRQALLAHELAHQVRRDPQWQAFALALHALLWMQPLTGLARRRLAALAELQADAWAARAVHDPRALAECLAECAERLTVRWADRRVALFGAAMNHDSLLVERVDRLLEEDSMRVTTLSWMVRGSVFAVLATAAFVFPGCDMQSIHFTGSGTSTTVSISDDGETSVRVEDGSYSLHMRTNGATTFEADESDVATLGPNCEFKLDETMDGVEHVYTVKADASGKLTRTLTRDGSNVPLDAAGKQWVADALPRMFNHSGFDAEARVARLLASGGPERVLAEVDRSSSDHSKAIYLGELLGTAKLNSEQTALALASAARIGSDYDLRSALSRALETQSLDAPRFTLLLKAAGQMESDYEQAELLIESVKLLPDDADTRAAWVAAAGTLDSDYDLQRSLEAGLAHSTKDPAFTAQLIALAAQTMDSDYSLRTVLESAAPRASDPVLASAYLSAVRQIDSDYDRHSALLTLIGAAKLDATSLAGALDATASIDSNYEKSEVLKALAPKVAGSAELTQRYRDVASTLADYERGTVLLALDQASRT